ncbi:chaperone protein dnaJ 49-like [Rutidosis leptorrhynchoides]|uniref:chaperone protein dnaJ 49-like n=1 Tax=Rutidosis leptorrhynchoides TaxID=125765 RepID=UPI003A9A3E0B
MDGNKDDALRCLKIAKDALRSGDRDRALKFISKAKRLDPDIPVDNLVSNLEPENTTNESGSGSGSGLSKQPENDSGVRRRVPVTETGSSGSKGYTEEQVMIASEIKRKKDYYEILGLEKNCSVEDVRKAYRKLSLKVHPDKNKAPGSEEAFKKVSKAFQCLSVEENRKQYDLVGSDEPVYETRAARRGARGNGFYYEGDVDAEEIFRNFFFGGMNPRATTQFTGFSFGPGTGVRMQAGNGSGGMRSLIQLLPVLLIILLNFLPSNEPIYSLSRTYGYDHVLTTQKGVNFYVKSRNFEQDYPLNSQERERLEERIERDYVSILSHNCRLEIQRNQWGYYQQETPNCDRLKQFEAIT